MFRPDNRVLLILFFLLIFGFLISLKTLLTQFTFGDMDGYARANWGYMNYSSEKYLTFNSDVPSWLPFHADILAISYYFLKNTQLAPRLITLIINVLSIPLMFLYSKRLFSKYKYSEIVGFTAVTIYTLLPLRLQLATQPLSEPICMFFLLLILWMLTAEKPKLLPIIILINIASAIRFEFWFIIPLILYIFFIKRKNIHQFLISLLLLIVFPTFWCILNYIYSGDFLNFFYLKYTIAQVASPQTPYFNLFFAFKVWIFKLFQLIGIFGILVAIHTIIRLVSEKYITKQNVVFIFLPIYFLLLLIAQVYLGTMEVTLHRYLYIVVIGLIPIISHGLISSFDLIRMRMKNKYFIIMAVIIVICLIEALNLFENANHYSEPNDNHDLEQVFQFTKYYNENSLKLSSKKILYVNPKWLMPMFIFFTQRYDIKNINISEYKDIADKNNTLVILNNEDNLTSTCTNEVLFKNEYFSFCNLKN